MKTALIFGVDGQDGSYLAEFLLEKGYRVVGWTPEHAPVNQANLQHVQGRFEWVQGSLTDQDGLSALLEKIAPHEVYNLAAPSFAAASWNAPVFVGEIAALGPLRILEALRLTHPTGRFFQASSSELFGLPVEVPQNEQTRFHPRNPYGLAKLYAHWAVVNYRERYGLYATSGILYNHESPRRGLDFVTRKIVHGALQIKLGQAQQLRLGNLDARRDWGFAGDYVQAMWKMLQLEQAEDFVIGSGETHAVREWCELSFGALQLDYRQYVVTDAQLYRPDEKFQLVADIQKARARLAWQPHTSFAELVGNMLAAESAALDYPLYRQA